MGKFITGILIALTLVVGVAATTAPAYAASSTDAAKKQVCSGVSGQTGSSCGTGGVNLNKIIGAVLNIISAIAGVLAVIMIIISGLKYITSSGEAQAIASAKNTLIYAIVGIIVVATSQIIVHYVLKNIK